MRRWIFAMSLACLLVASGCGYSTRGLYSEDIETVAVPIFKVKGLRRDVEFQLTEKVAKAIEAQTPFKVVQTGGDTELRGTIETFYKMPYGEDGFDNPRGGTMTMTLSVEWVDNRSGKVIRESNQTFTLNQIAPYVIDLGQSQATATNDLLDDMTNTIISLMQAPW